MKNGIHPFSAERSFENAARTNGRPLNDIEGKVIDNVEARLMG